MSAAVAVPENVAQGEQGAEEPDPGAFGGFFRREIPEIEFSHIFVDRLPVPECVCGIHCLKGQTGDSGKFRGDLFHHVLHFRKCRGGYGRLNIGADPGRQQFFQVGGDDLIMAALGFLNVLQDVEGTSDRNAVLRYEIDLFVIEKRGVGDDLECDFFFQPRTLLLGIQNSRLEQIPRKQRLSAADKDDPLCFFRGTFPGKEEIHHGFQLIECQFPVRASVSGITVSTGKIAPLIEKNVQYRKIVVGGVVIGQLRRRFPARQRREFAAAAVVRKVLPELFRLLFRHQKRSTCQRRIYQKQRIIVIESEFVSGRDGKNPPDVPPPVHPSLFPCLAESCAAMAETKSCPVVLENCLPSERRISKRRIRLRSSQMMSKTSLLHM